MFLLARGSMQPYEHHIIVTFTKGKYKDNISRRGKFVARDLSVCVICKMGCAVSKSRRVLLKTAPAAPTAPAPN